MRKSQPYPDVHACIGNFIGHFNERDWWHATGKAREAFRTVEKQLLDHLQAAFKDTYRSIVHFHLFMIGRALSSARPTIMFFCEEKEPRKRAKKVIDESSILKQLPGFRTGQQARQPNIGTLIQPATDGESGLRSIQPSLRADVYYHPSDDIQAIGMPIFVKHSNGRWRGATAYRVFKNDKCFLMSVAHVCIESIPITNDLSDDDSDFDFGSEAGNDIGDDNQSSTTFSASRNLSSTSPDTPWGGDDSMDGTEDSDKTALSDGIESFGYSIPNSQSNGFRRLGRLHASNVNADWALISIEDEIVLFGLMNDELAPTASYVGEIVKGAQSVVCIAGQAKKTKGTFAENGSYIRLPGSRIFQEVYSIVLDKAIDWGDCGAICMDSELSVSYGHIVASSEDKLTVFAVPAPSVLQLSGTAWTMSAPQTLRPKSARTASFSKTPQPNFTGHESKIDGGTLQAQTTPRNSYVEDEDMFSNATALRLMTTSTQTPHTAPQTTPSNATLQAQTTPRNSYVEDEDMFSNATALRLMTTSTQTPHTAPQTTPSNATLQAQTTPLNSYVEDEDMFSSATALRLMTTSTQTPHTAPQTTPSNATTTPSVSKAPYPKFEGSKFYGANFQPWFEGGGVMPGASTYYTIKAPTTTPHAYRQQEYPQFAFNDPPSLAQPSYIDVASQPKDIYMPSAQPQGPVISGNSVGGGSRSFFFRIDEFIEHPEAIEQYDQDGRWIPRALAGYNIRQHGLGVSDQWWHCDGQKIRLKSNWSPPAGSVPYKIFSTIYSAEHGFHVLRGDATNPPEGETWHDLSFNWDETTLSSALTNAGFSRSLRVHNPNSRWPRILLPDIYHGPEYSDTDYGGLTGELAIFLALIALSMKPDRLPTQLPKMMADGEWKEHQGSHHRKFLLEYDHRSRIPLTYHTHRRQQARGDCLRLLARGK
jgi:hypothetical protein